jgi:hypothetical protein
LLSGKPERLTKQGLERTAEKSKEPNSIPRLLSGKPERLTNGLTSTEVRKKMITLKIRSMRAPPRDYMAIKQASPQRKKKVKSGKNHNFFSSIKGMINFS